MVVFVTIVYSLPSSRWTGSFYHDKAVAVAIVVVISGCPLYVQLCCALSKWPGGIDK